MWGLAVTKYSTIKPEVLPTYFHKLQNLTPPCPMSKATQDWDQTARKCCLLSSVRHLRKKHSILLIPFAQQVMGAKAPWKPFQFTKSSQGTVWHATTIHTSSTPSDCPNAPVELGPAGRISAAAPAVPPATGEILSHSLGRWMSQWWTEVSKRSKWLRKQLQIPVCQ